MDWIAWLVVALMLAPFYVYVISKFAGAGWVSGIRSYIRTVREKR